MRSNTAAVFEGEFDAHAPSNIYHTSTGARSVRSARILGSKKNAFETSRNTQCAALLEKRFKRMARDSIHWCLCSISQMPFAICE